MVNVWRTALVGLFVFCLSSAGVRHTLAQDGEPPKGDGGVAYHGTGPEGGLAPGLRAGKGAMLSWPGFQMMPDGSSRVFLQMSEEVPHTVAREGQTLVVTFKGAKVLHRNHHRPLLTRFFNTPVTRVKVKAVRRAVRVELALRADVTPQVRAATGADGLHYVYIEFPAGDYLGPAQ